MDRILAIDSGLTVTKAVIFDLKGRLVRLVTDEHRPAGTYAIVWDGRDAAGRTAASGAYYVRLETGDDSDLMKVMLLK